MGLSYGMPEYQCRAKHAWTIPRILYTFLLFLTEQTHIIIVVEYTN